MLPKNFLEKIQDIEQKYAQTEEKLASLDITKDADTYKALSKDLKELSYIHELYKDYNKILKDIEDTKELLKDKDLRELAEKELENLNTKLLQKEKELINVLTPKDANDSKNVILEIRAGAGGEEAALFAADLLRMYQRYAERKGWKFNILEANKTGLGGYKEVIVSIEGKNVYSHLKYESGVHRVQRVPITESGGRIHTSTITVAVLPEADETDVVINPQDLRIETFRASGAGGQYVNTTESAVRITHIPTGISISCQDERSQLQNKLKAMRILYARLKDFYEKQKKEETDKERKEQVGTGERSEKIRTYNFSQNRVTDHRINLTLHKLQDVLDGDLDDIISSLQAKELEEKLASA
ncbi:peptide chain release factor 1 [Hydrogenobaculum sp. Y04AAS1]|uniref:Peptide chain release factor 1 n=1 Tax=Hydrogenobaculum sp. (strain Y04AAS1) TaxID=380749 RepID=RF1_HYDS0|nr:RecName: Full=Peptide chain release factor 1; Short=RF-1 [Hydrogenobaculum sp. Y04AAS1]ACG57666.1 peptide chain release factor 1 [Hydrogenobaculum sp. Y04AAS1]HCT66231.1 peptide chain release factor 1 [Hydrogenobaculum sp.]